MANPRKFSEKIALHNQKQAEETAAFEKIMQEVSAATNRVNPSSQLNRVKPPEPVATESTLKPAQQSLGTFRSGSLPNVAAPQATNIEPENIEPEETSLATQYGLGGRSGGTSPSRAAGPRSRASSSVGPMRRPAERKLDTSPYSSNSFLSPPQDGGWRRTNSDSALHQSCGVEQPPAALSQHHPLHSHAHPHAHQHQNHRRAEIHLDALGNMGVNVNSRPRSSCEIPRIPNNTNVYETGGGGGGGLSCGDLQVPGGSLPDLTSVHFPPPHPAYGPLPHRTGTPHYHHQPSPTSPGAVSPGAGSVSPATGGLSPASGSPVGATVPSLTPLDALHAAALYDTQNHLSVPNTNNYLHQNKNMPLDHSWMTASYQPHCSPPSQYSSTSNINIPSPTMVHSPGSPVESPRNDYSSLHQQILEPFGQITMDWAQLVQSLVESGWTAHVQVAENLDDPVSGYNATYINHSSPHSPQTTNSPHTYSQSSNNGTSPFQSTHRPQSASCGTHAHECRPEPRQERDPVPGGNGPVFPALQSPTTPASIPDIILTDYSGELDGGIFGGEEAQLRAELDLDDLSMLDQPSSLLPDSAVEHEFRLDRL